MNALATRDQMFSTIHAELLKPRGFAKRAHWSVKQQGEFCFAVYLRASRWSSKDQADFWFDLKVFHQGFHTLLTGELELPVLKEGTPSLVEEILGEREGPQFRQLVIDQKTDPEHLRLTVEQRMLSHAFPMMEECSTLEGALRYLIASPAWPRLAGAAAGICLLTGEKHRAAQYMQQARNEAPHANTRQWLERRFAQMEQNLEKVKASSPASNPSFKRTPNGAA